ncbi:8823_t:CDS:2, partial [Racocetra fulgida]
MHTNSNSKISILNSYRYIYSGIIELDQLDGADLLRLMLASDELQLPILITHAQDHLIKTQSEWINQTLVPILHIVCHHGTFGKLLRKPFRKLLPSLIEEQILQFYLDPESRVHNVFLPRNITSGPIDSVLIDGRHATLISNWIDRKDTKLNLKRKNPYKFNLLVRASKDGFGVDVFHNRCDSVARTLVLAKVKGTNQIVGGYNPIKWNFSENSHGTSVGPHKSFKKFGSTSDSFIFSFNDTLNPTMATLSRLHESLDDEAVYFSHSYGPCFGQNDLHMVDQSWNCRKTSYNHEILPGRSNFIADDYEVFQIVENDGLKEKKTEVLEE